MMAGCVDVRTIKKLKFAGPKNFEPPHLTGRADDEV
jgi:hypothetical protein